MGILDKSFKYTPAAHSDIRKTFKRIIAEQKRAAAEQSKVVRQIKRVKS